MTVDMKRMRKTYQDNQRGGDFWTPDQGITCVYVHPPCRPDDPSDLTKGTNYLPVVVHYGVGPKGEMAVCLDGERNPIILHPFVKKALLKRKIKLSGKSCHVCDAIENGELPDDKADDAQPNTRFLWGITPVTYKASKAGEWSKLTPKPSPAMLGATIYNGLMDLFMENEDITDPAGAIFALIYRTGKNKNDTKYEVKVDPRTLKKPMKLPPAVWNVIKKAMKPEGDCDLFKIVANLIKGPDEVKALVAGVRVDTDEGGDDDDDDAWGKESDDDDELEDGEDDDESEDGEDDDESEDDESEDDDSEDDDSEDDDSEGDESEDDESEDEELEDGEDEEDEEPAPPPKKSKKPSKPVKAKPSKPSKAKKPQPDDDDDDDMGLDELDAELERMTKGKKGKK